MQLIFSLVLVLPYCLAKSQQNKDSRGKVTDPRKLTTSSSKRIISSSVHIASSGKAEKMLKPTAKGEPMAPSAVPPIPDSCSVKSLTCHSGCSLSYDDKGCPHNCNCGQLIKCPKVNCPRLYPSCSVVTLIDGCQTCGCMDPVVVLGDDEGEDEIYLVSIKPAHISDLVGDDASKTKLIEVLHYKRGRPVEKLLEDAVLYARDHPKHATIIEMKDDASYVISPILMAKEKPLIIAGPPCTPQMRKSLDKRFWIVYRLLHISRSMPTPEQRLFPALDRFGTARINQACWIYRRALKKIDKTAAKTCRAKHLQFAETMAHMEYFCWNATEINYQRHYDCISSSIHNEIIANCLQLAKSRLLDPFVDKCDVYNIFAECIYDPLKSRCGATAWNVMFKYLTINVRLHLAGTCRVEKITRDIEL